MANSNRLLLESKRIMVWRPLRGLYASESTLRLLRPSERKEMARCLNSGDIPESFPLPYVNGMTKKDAMEVIDAFDRALLTCLFFNPYERADVLALVNACHSRELSHNSPSLKGLTQFVGNVARDGRETLFLERQAQEVVAGLRAVTSGEGVRYEDTLGDELLDGLFLDFYARYEAARDQVRDSDAASTCKELFDLLLPLFVNELDIYSEREKRSQERARRILAARVSARNVKADVNGVSLLDELVVGSLDDFLGRKTGSAASDCYLIALEDKLNDLKRRA